MVICVEAIGKGLRTNVAEMIFHCIVTGGENPFARVAFVIVIIIAFCQHIAADVAPVVTALVFAFAYHSLAKLALVIVIGILAV